jgi:hypothetical protein
VQETPEAALVAAQAYLLTTQPEPGDSREHIHQAAIRSLGLVEDRLRKHPPEKKAIYHKDKGKENFKHQPSQSQMIRPKRIYNFLCSMLIIAPFALCFVTLRGIFM